MQTVCPDQFCGRDGPVPSGSVCVTVTGHNSGSAIQHLQIPARYLTPANPTGKKSAVLSVKGTPSGEDCAYTKMSEEQQGSGYTG